MLAGQVGRFCQHEHCNYATSQLGIELPIPRRAQRRKNLAVTAKAFLTLALVGCAYDTRFTDCTVRCSVNMECPEDLTCGAEGLCRASDATEACVTVLGPPPSCAGLAATCGPSADENCCSTGTRIPGGTFFRSYDLAADGMYPSTNYSATVSPFAFDRFEVTVGRFRKFVEEGSGARTIPPPAGAGARPLNGMANQGGWDASWVPSLAIDTNALVAALKCGSGFQSWTDAPGTNEELPINCITWYEAFAFCAWDGGFLPTEAEWNFAAAGGAEQRGYPWSIPASSLTIDCTRANYGACTSTIKHVGSESPEGDGTWGQTDLAGNVNEWTLDWFANYATPCNDCANLTDTTEKVARGGGYFDDPNILRTGIRGHISPSTRYTNVGVRCARRP